MMLHRTVPELRRTPGWTRELGRSIAYLEEHDPTDDLWQMTATICCAIYRAAGDKRAQPSHFLPKRFKAADHTPQTLADKFRSVFGVARSDDPPKAGSGARAKPKGGSDGHRGNRNHPA